MRSNLDVGEVEVEAVSLIPHLLLRNSKAEHKKGSGDVDATSVMISQVLKVRSLCDSKANAKKILTDCCMEARTRYSGGTALPRLTTLAPAPSRVTVTVTVSDTQLQACNRFQLAAETGSFH
jgi:hypothetical protein